MLDLTNIYANKTYDVKLFDGTEIHLKRPTQAIQEFLVNLQSININENAKEAMDGVMSVFLRILNRNTDGRTFTLEEVENEYDVTIAMFVIQDYFQFWTKDVESQVDFPQSQQ